MSGYVVALELAKGGSPCLDRGAGSCDASTSFPLRFFESSRAHHDLRGEASTPLPAFEENRYGSKSPGRAEQCRKTLRLRARPRTLAP